MSSEKRKESATLLPDAATPALVAAIGAASAALLTLCFKKKKRNNEDPLARPWLSSDSVVVDDLAALRRETTSTSRSPLPVVADLSDKSLRRVDLAELEGATFAKLSGNGGLELVVPRPFSKKKLALAALRSIDLSRCSLREVPGGLASACPGLRDLDLSHNDLVGSLGASEGGGKSLPPFPPSLLRLNAQGNRRLTSVDGGALSPLTSLVLLGLKSCSLDSLPGEALGKLRRLRELYVTDNRLKLIPKEIGQCESLVKLQASFNDLESLPLRELSKLPRLEMLRVAACRISELEGLEEIVFGNEGLSPSSSPSAPPPSSAPFRSLCWVSLAGNPVFERCVPPPRTEAARVFHLGDVLEDGKEGEKLGSGASGDVVSVRVRGGGETVAFKRFRGDAGPDGRACDEISVARAVCHGALASTVGTVVFGPGGASGEEERERGTKKKNNKDKSGKGAATDIVATSASSPSQQRLPAGLLLELVEGKPLAEKPRGDPLLRCTWPSKSESNKMSPRSALVAAARLASALDHLHSELGCSHGDFYAHNVLCDSGSSSSLGKATLVDFGAAFFYERSPSSPSAFEAFEQRAFGIFLRELAEHGVDENDGGASLARAALERAATSAADAAPAERPGFSALASELAAAAREAGYESGDPVLA